MQPSDITEPHEAHIDKARAVFRAVGFSLAAMQYPRPHEALLALKRFNGVADDWPTPFAWGFFPNAYCRDLWLQHGRLA